MVRIIANRPILFVALALCLGLFLGYTILAVSISIWIVISIFSLAILFLSIFRVFKKVKHLQAINGFLIAKRVLVIFCVSFYFVGTLLFGIVYTTFSNKSLENRDFAISGVVCDNIYASSSLTSINIDKLTLVDTTSGEILHPAGKLQISIFNKVASELDGLEVGAKVQLITSIKAKSAIEFESFNSWNYKYDIRYQASLGDLNSISFSSGAAPLNHKINQAILEMLLSNMPSDTAHLAYSVLFGDSSQLTEEMLNTFRVSGVLHIIAVSGMNVVLIIGVFLFLFRYIKARKLIQFIVIAFVLFLYCYLCAFAPSVTRASIMALVFLSARFIGRQGDTLSSLGLSAIIILAISPLALFDPSFLLSFACVVGIVLLCPPMQKFFESKLKMPKWLASGTAITITAQIGILPIMAFFFNNLSLYSVLANIVVVPVFSLAYILLFCFILVCAILPFMGFLLMIPSLLFSFIIIFPTIFVNLPFASVIIYSIGIASVVYYLLIFAISSFALLKARVKAIVASLLCVLFVCSMIITNLDTKYTSLQYVNIDSGTQTVLMTSDENYKLLYGVGRTTKDYNNIRDELIAKRMRKLDAVMFLSMDNSLETNNLKRLINEFMVGEVVLFEDRYSSSTLSLLRAMGQNYCVVSEFETLNKGSFIIEAFHDFTGGFLGISFICNGTNTLVVKNSLNEAATDMLLFSQTMPSQTAIVGAGSMKLKRYLSSKGLSLIE